MDIVIRGGRVIDGAGHDGVADVAVDAGRVIGVGNGFGVAKRTIDARGKIVAPGFVDLHTHSDFTLPIRPAAEAKLLQGVTTDITGNCGFSPFPLNGDEAARRHGIFFESALTDRWCTLRDFTETLRDARPAINIAPLVGLGAIRLAVMGEARVAPSTRQLEEMRAVLARELGAGAFGASSGLIYPPGSYASKEEIAALAEVVAEYGALYATHIRNESSELEAAVTEALDVAAATGCLLQISHHKVFGRDNWGKVDSTLSLIENANEDGANVCIDVYPYTAGSTSLAALLPPQELDGGEQALKSRLADAAERARIGRHVEESSFASLDTVLIANSPSRPQLTGRMLTAAAAEHGVSDSEFLLQLIELDGRDALMVVFGMSESDVRQVLTHPLSMVASDGWTMATDSSSYAHPRNFAYTARFLSHYVRDEALIDLPEAIAKLSTWPARRLGLRGRGELTRGAVADIVVFDLDNMSEESSFDDPCQHPKGFEHVLVSGQLAVDDGETTGLRRGGVLAREG